MGIPHLIGTLEPYAVHRELGKEDIVVDGPSFAYHILHVCRLNQIKQPCYKLLGQVAISWLDELVDKGSSVKAIYFDGFLPPAKRTVRMQRLLKSNSQQIAFSSQHPMGCATDYLSDQDGFSDVELFKIGHIDSKPISPPPFLVPTIMDALRTSNRYSDKIQLVPGEADMYCATHVASDGGLILTSDSDLLAHDLDQGTVALFRDIYRDDAAGLRASIFCPRDICQRLEIPGPFAACRFAYERKRSVNATADAIIRACKAPVVEQKAYDNFRKEYVYDTSMDDLLASASNNKWTYKRLDPRVSELILQFTGTKGRRDGIQPKMYLPVLIESPERGSVWEPTTPIRQLAYSIASLAIANKLNAIQEYRRVQNLEQKGRQIDGLSNQDITVEAAWLLDIAHKIQNIPSIQGYSFWLFFGLMIDIVACSQQEKQSHLLRIIRQRQPHIIKISSRVSWDMVHFMAQIHASLYSLRILQQVLNMFPPKKDEILHKNCVELIHLLDGLPQFSEYPDIHNTAALLNLSRSKPAIDLMRQFLALPQDFLAEKNTSIKRPSDGIANKATTSKKSKSKHAHAPAHAQAPAERRLANTKNRFGALYLEEE